MEFATIKLLMTGSISIKVSNRCMEWELNDNKVISKKGDDYDNFCEQIWVEAKTFDHFDKQIKGFPISKNWGMDVLKGIQSCSEFTFKESSEREINNLRFLQDSDVHCPKYICSYKIEDVYYLKMEKIEGKLLSDVLDHEQIDTILNNLYLEIKKLRSLVFTDKQNTYNDPWFGELDLNSFNESLVNKTKGILLRKLVEPLLPKENKFVLSHGDLYFENIIIKEDLSVYIINWETLCYLPDYWDFLKLSMYDVGDHHLSDYFFTKLNIDAGAFLGSYYMLRSLGVL